AIFIDYVEYVGTGGSDPAEFTQQYPDLNLDPNRMDCVSNASFATMRDLDVDLEDIEPFTDIHDDNLTMPMGVPEPNSQAIALIGLLFGIFAFRQRRA
ncbi:MAG: PEP-CTERM sorting domain-containing protein, partial [Planctomycetota bacterium]